MSPRYKHPMSPAEIAAVDDDAIDFSEIPDLHDAFWVRARVMQPDQTGAVTLQVRDDVVEACKAATGGDYAQRMSAVLKHYASRLKRTASR